MLTKTLELASAALVIMTLPGSIEIALSTLGSIVLLPKHPDANAAGQDAQIDSLAVVIPAHDESATILRCIESLQSCDALGNGRKVTIVVVADNCADNTAELARRAGAITIVRVDGARQGKGFALQDAFEKLLPAGFDAFVIVDADSVVDRNFLREVAGMLDAGADAVQTRYLTLDSDASLPSRLSRIALMAFNVLRPRSRDRLGLSAGLLGNGFALPRKTLLTVPYSASSIVEDLEYHLRLVSAGKRVVFADRTTVWADMPTGTRALATQRTRWEGGRLRMVKLNAIGLARQLVYGNFRALEPLLELTTLPLSFHVPLLLMILIIGSTASQTYASMAIALVAGHIILALFVAGGELQDLALLLLAPFYIAWKLILSVQVFRFARRDAKWLRTQRSQVASDPQIKG